MPIIFEIFGYPIDDHSDTANRFRRLALCPFMDCDCDGGGNRYLSHIHLKNRPDLALFFPDREIIPSGICSIQLKKDESPWVVCPRRLLVLGHEGMGSRAHQEYADRKMLALLGYPSGTHLGVWPEVKIKFNEKIDDVNVLFDYSFDYILMPLESVSSHQLEQDFDMEWSKIKRMAEKTGYTVARRNGQEYIEDCPSGRPSIIEIMTSSTSGGDQKKRTAIPLAFEDAILGKTHKAPGINYRQVWARMASQMIVKSEVAIRWGGKTIWVVQDLLANYISSSTALNLKHFISKHTSEVNMLALSYGDGFRKPEGIMELEDSEFYAGPISNRPLDGGPDEISFQDIIRVAAYPSLRHLRSLLLRKKPTNKILVG